GWWGRKVFQLPRLGLQGSVFRNRTVAMAFRPMAYRTIHLIKRFTFRQIGFRTFQWIGQLRTGTLIIFQCVRIRESLETHRYGARRWYLGGLPIIEIWVRLIGIITQRIIHIP